MSTTKKAKRASKPRKQTAAPRTEANAERLASHARGMCSSLEEVEANAKQLTDLLGELCADVHIGTGGLDEVETRLQSVNAVAWRIRWNLGFTPEKVSP